MRKSETCWAKTTKLSWNSEKTLTQECMWRTWAPLKSLTLTSCKPNWNRDTPTEPWPAQIWTWTLPVPTLSSWSPLKCVLSWEMAKAVFAQENLTLSTWQVLKGSRKHTPLEIASKKPSTSTSLWQCWEMSFLPWSMAKAHIYPIETPNWLGCCKTHWEGTPEL